MQSVSATPSVCPCPICGLVQTVPAEASPRELVCCSRCRATLINPAKIARSASRTAAFATAALILYPLAVTLPIVEIEQFGYMRDASIITGIGRLFESDHALIAIIVLFCSVLFPLTKLLGLLALTTGARALSHHHRAWAYRIVDLTGRWGMLDVLLVAILVAAVKIGDLVDVSAGPGALAFAMLVLLSLLAGASFDPHLLWRADESDSSPRVTENH